MEKKKTEAVEISYHKIMSSWKTVKIKASKKLSIYVDSGFE
jgi:hypothetical protein